MQYASIGNPDMAYDHLVALEAPPMTLKEQAEILQKGASIYNSFAEEHPIIAEYGTSATLLGVKTLVAGAAGAIEHLIVEVRGRVIGSVLGLDAAINGSINQAAKIFKKIDVSLSDEESHTLAAAYILGPIMLAGSAQDIKFATSKIAGKLKFQDKVKIENEFEKTASLDGFFSKTIDKSGTGSLTKFGKTDIDLGSKFKFKGLEIDVIKGLDEIKIPVSNNPGQSKIIWKGGKNAIYRDESLGVLGNKALFWSKDIDHHGGVGYKLFTESGKGFSLVANIAPDGKIIKNKHQSEPSNFINKKDLVCTKNEK
jgi:hypothetical protein